MVCIMLFWLFLIKRCLIKVTFKNIYFCLKNFSWSKVIKHLLTLLFFAFFIILHRSILYHLFFLIFTWTAYQMIYIISTIKQLFSQMICYYLSLLLLMLKFLRLLIKLRFEKQIWINTIYVIYGFRVEQTDSGSRTYLNEKLNLYHHREKCSNACKIRKSVLLLYNLFINFKM